MNLEELRQAYASSKSYFPEYITALEAECERLRELHVMQLAGIMTASLQNTEATIKDRIGKDNPYWTQAYEDVCVAVDREMKHRAECERLRGLVKDCANHSALWGTGLWNQLQDELFKAAPHPSGGGTLKERTKKKGHMTVKELIEKLKTQPEDAVVNTVHARSFFDTNVDGYALVDSVTIEPDTRFGQPKGIKITFIAN